MEEKKINLNDDKLDNVTGGVGTQTDITVTSEYTSEMDFTSSAGSRHTMDSMYSSNY